MTNRISESKNRQVIQKLGIYPTLVFLGDQYWVLRFFFCICKWYTDCISAEGWALPPNECPGYNTKQSDSEILVMLDLWGMLSTPSLPSLLGPLWSGVVAPDRVLSMGQIELKCVLMLNWIVWIRTVWLNCITWNRNDFDN